MSDTKKKRPVFRKKQDVEKVKDINGKKKHDHEEDELNRQIEFDFGDLFDFGYRGDDN